MNSKFITSCYTFKGSILTLVASSERLLPPNYLVLTLRVVGDEEKLLVDISSSA